MESPITTHRPVIQRRHLPPRTTQMDIARIRRRRISIQIDETRVIDSDTRQKEHRGSFSGRELVHDDLDDFPDSGNVTKRTDDRHGAPRTVLGECELYVCSPYRTVRTDLIRMSGSIVKKPANSHSRNQRHNQEYLDQPSASPPGRGDTRMSFAIHRVKNFTRKARHRNNRIRDKSRCSVPRHILSRYTLHSVRILA
jgi:hypothetical protein